MQLFTTKNNRISLTIVTAITAASLAAPSMAADEYFVDGSVETSGNGESWATAKKYLKEALTIATTENDVIKVAEGTYYPDEDSSYPNGSGNKSESFTPTANIKVYGGYPEGGGTADPNTYVTILSGDIDKDDVWWDGDNSYHVIDGTAQGVDSARFEGFTITHGFASGEDDNGKGGGAINGGIMFVNCYFYGNGAKPDGGGQGGWRQGGAIAQTSGPAKVYNCSFAQNNSNAGGAIAIFPSDDTSIIVNCLFQRNFGNEGDSEETERGGGAIWIKGTEADEPSVEIHCCTFTGYREGIDRPIETLGNCTVNIKDCIFRDERSAGR